MSKDHSERLLGVENNAVHLSEHRSVWAELYCEEERRIRTALGALIVDLQHIGSTAIPGIKAKPILDMLAGVERLENALLCKGPLESIDYDYIARAGIANDYVFGKGAPRTHYLHVVEYGGAKWVNHLRFRDRLRNDPELAKAYETLKQELSTRFSNSHEKYHDAKAKFINEVVSPLK